MNKANPQVSVIMPVRNGEAFIKDAIKSILRQTYYNFELLIINDASKDNSISIVSSFQDKRIRIINNPRHLGLAQSRNRGIRQARGQLITFLDCDDLAHPNRIARSYHFLSRNRNIRAVGSWVKVIDSNGKPRGPVWKHATDPEVIAPLLLFRNCFTQSAMTVEKSCLLEFPYRRQFLGATDYDLWVRLSVHYRMANIPQVLTFYRLTGTNMSVRQKDKTHDKTRQIHKNHLSMLGIKATPSDVILHDNLEYNIKGFDIDRIVQIEQWLVKLYKWHINNPLYGKFVFNRLLSDYWLKVCAGSAHLGLSVWETYRKSQLRTLDKNIKKDALLAALCLSRRPRSIDVTSPDWIRWFS